MTYLVDRGLTPETIEHFCLIEDEDRVLIPYFNALGGAAGSRLRLLNSGGAKYLTPKGQKNLLFNIRDAGMDLVFITEGEFDCMVLHQTGRHAVGVVGVQGFKPYFAWLFLGTNVKICFDGDDAGRSGALKIARMLQGVADEVEIIELPTGQDITDVFLEGKLEEVLGG